MRPLPEGYAVRPVRIINSAYEVETHLTPHYMGRPISSGWDPSFYGYPKALRRAMKACRLHHRAGLT